MLRNWLKRESWSWFEFPRDVALKLVVGKQSDIGWVGIVNPPPQSRGPCRLPDIEGLRQLMRSSEFEAPTMDQHDDTSVTTRTPADHAA